jgi:hypothetical protein
VLLTRPLASRQPFDRVDVDAIAACNIIACFEPSTYFLLLLRRHQLGLARPLCDSKKQAAFLPGPRGVQVDENLLVGLLARLRPGQR